MVVMAKTGDESLWRRCAPSCPSGWTLELIIYRFCFSFFPQPGSDTNGGEVAAIVAGETIGLTTGRDRRKESEVSGWWQGRREGSDEDSRMGRE